MKVNVTVTLTRDYAIETYWRSMMLKHDAET
jgi:hypothetical protein